MVISSKRRKPVTGEEENEDIISYLPDGVLNHILSFLPTKTSVSTARLSSRWRHLWQHLSILHFSDDSHEYVDQPAERFKSFSLLVNGVLALLRNPRAIRKMSLSCAHSFSDDKFREYSVETWVRAAVGPHLHELELTLFSDEDGPDFKLPQTLFSCPNLVSLSLSGAVHVSIQHSTVVSLPSLKMLMINIGYVEVSSVNALLDGCSNLEILDLCFSAQSLDKLCVPPSVKRLKITIENDVGAYLEVNAPDLQYLNITQITFGEGFSLYNLPNVVEAYLDVFPTSLGSIVPLHNLFGALYGTKHLMLSRSTTKWLLGEPHEMLFQEFRYLIRLELVLPWFNSNSLIHLIQKCPLLQVLKIQNDKERSPILAWSPQPSIPNCLVSHLSFIEFKGFRGFPDEVSFVEYVLQKGHVLKTLIIADISLDLKKKYFILKLLSDVPRASAMCQLKFD